MAITNKEKELLLKRGLSEDLTLYNIFSVFLENKILNLNSIDISHIPNEYLLYINDLYDNIDESGDLILVTMLFTEYVHNQKTGKFKLQLSESKYKQLGSQFALYCLLELLRRNGDVITLKSQQLFNPNLKTWMQIDSVIDIQDIIDQLIALDVNIS